MKKVLCFLFLLVTCGCSVISPAVMNEPVDDTPVETLNQLVFQYEEEAKAGFVQEQETLLNNYFTRYHQGMGTFQTDELRDLFADETERELENAIWTIFFTIRQSALLRLTYSKYQTTITVQEIVEEANDIWRYELYEDTTVQFDGLPADTHSFLRLAHTFLLKQTETGYKILHHDSSDTIYDTFADQDVSVVLAQQLEEIRTNLSQRSIQGEESEEVKNADHPYDRDAAVTYAQYWVAKRNPDWFIYDRLGGNCQNFVSQCLYAGGIPFDYHGYNEQQWKWYDEEENLKAEPSGYVDSFIQVSIFNRYLDQKDTGGLVADRFASYDRGDRGDIMQLGNDVIRHTALISDRLQSEDGTLIDYLLCSNTLDYQDYPASALYYTLQQVVKVYGYDD